MFVGGARPAARRTGSISATSPCSTSFTRAAESTFGMAAVAGPWVFSVVLSSFFVRTGEADGDRQCGGQHRPRRGARREKSVRLERVRASAGRVVGGWFAVVVVVLAVIRKSPGRRS